MDKRLAHRHPEHFSYALVVLKSSTGTSVLCVLIATAHCLIVTKPVLPAGGAPKSDNYSYALGCWWRAGWWINLAFITHAPKGQN